jgi:hypothetical protein
MDLSLDIYRGAVIATPYLLGESTGFFVAEATPTDLSRVLGAHLRGLLPAANVTHPNPRKFRGWSFHWSNAFGSWDAKSWQDPSWHTDGAEFILYMAKDATSPSGRPWSLKDMEMVAIRLPEHPGFRASPESAGRVATRFLERGV